MNNIYPYSVFYFTKSVYDGAGQQKELQLRLFLKAVLINARFKEKINTHITFTTKEILELVKAEPYVCNFKGLLQLGENIAFPEEDETIRGDKNFRLVQFATNKDGDILGLIKIVVDDYETKQALKKIIDKDNYPATLISSEEAVEELKQIESKLFNLFG